MAVTLHEFKHDASLQFAGDDRERVSAAAWRLFGEPQATPYPTFTLWRFGQGSLMFEDDPDDPCLTANDPGAIAMLRALLGELTGG
jgi:hypothetical protein